MNLAFLLVDHTGWIHHAHVGVSALLGREAATCEGSGLHDVLPSDELWEAFLKVRAGGVHNRTIVVNLDAPIRQLLLSLSSLGGATVEPMVAVLIASADDRETNATLRLRATLESVISGFAHEVRNPLAAILSISEAALSNLNAKTVAASMLMRIPGLVNRVDKLIKESLRLSRPKVPKRSPQRLRHLVEWSLAIAQVEAGPVSLDVCIDDALGLVMVDPEQFEQVLVNLLCNARDAARGGVSLTVRRGTPFVARGKRRPQVVIEVSDDGAGIPAELRDRIFEPFFTTKAHGTGLGLAIARELARINEVELALHSTSDQGTTFSLHLQELPKLALNPPGRKAL